MPDWRQWVLSLWLLLLGFPMLCWAQDSATTTADSHSLVSLNDALSQADLARLRAQAVGGRASSYLVYPALTINGVPSSYSLPTRVHNGYLSVDTEALRHAGVRVPARYDRWEPLAALGITGHYDNGAQQLSLTVPAAWLPRQQLHNSSARTETPVQQGFGALLNYNIYSTRMENGNTSTAASHEARLFSDVGAFSSSGVFRWSNHQPDYDGQYVRLDSYWRYTDARLMQTYVLGDTISKSLAWTPSVRMAGLQISRNFASRPDLITFPTPQINGSATLPSALDIFVNGLRMGRQQIQPGPFVMDTAPRLTGFGEVQVVTTDTLGRQSAQNVPFYVSPKLLREGLWDYSATVGTPRYHYGYRSTDYASRPVATGVVRYGMTDSLTLEGTGNASESLTNGGLGVVFKPGLLGVSNLAVAQGKDRNNQGTQWVVGHEFHSRYYGFSTQYTHRTKGYRDLSNSIDNLPGFQSSLQVNGSVNLDHHGNISSSYLRTRQFNGSDNEFLVLAYRCNLWRQLSASFSVNQNLNQGDDRTWQATFSYYFDRPGKRGLHASAQLSYDEQNRNTSSLFTLSEATEKFWDLGWDLAYSPEADGIRQASATWWTPYARAQAGVFGNRGNSNAFANVNGSLVTNYQDVFAANRINNSYAIVDTGGFAKVPVRRSNRLIGYSNRHGKLLIADLVPYVDNKLSIDVTDLPVDAQLEQKTLNIKPAELTGVTARFPIHQSFSAVATIKTKTGQPIAAGSQVSQADKGATVAGFDGEVFLQDLDSGHNTLDVQQGNHHCHVDFDFKPQSGTLPRIGPFVCEPDNQQGDQHHEHH
ncbi:MAG: fimbria/pilus outer membrane usher protein [Alcanivorax sp.]|nr:fimbria/pilus outer membrane usher protein [Alcanivorax sp.]